MLHPGYHQHPTPDPPRWWHKPLLCLLVGAVCGLVKWCSTGHW